MKTFCLFGSLLLLLILVVVPACHWISEPVGYGWQNRTDCGLNSLVWMVRRSGVPIGRAQVSWLVGEPDGQGYSLEQLEIAARRLCLFPSVQKIDIAELFCISPPYVAHLSAGGLDQGHFVTVVNIAQIEGELMLISIDGSSGEESKYSLSGAEKFFTGYVMTVSAFPLRVLLVVAAYACLLMLFRAIQRLRMGRNITKKCLLIVISMFCLHLECTHAICGENSTVSSMEQLCDEIRLHKRAILELPGGIRCNYRYRCTKDAVNDFAFKGDVKVTNAWKWPLLFVSYDSVLFSGVPQSRESVYDFELNKSFARDEHDGTIIQDRHMFSAAFCLLFRAAQWSEGYQGYRYGEQFSGDTIPEVFEKPGSSYVIKETEQTENGRVIHIANNLGDDIFIAMDRSYLPTRRVVRSRLTNHVVSTADLNSFVEVSKGIWLPTKMQTAEYFGPEGDHKLNMEFVVDRLEYELGVSDDQFQFRITDGLAVNDLIEDRNYIAGARFSKGGDNLRPLVLIASTAIIFVVLYLIVRKR